MADVRPMGEARVGTPGSSRDRRVRPTRRFLWLPVAAACAGVLVYTFLFGDTGYLRERSLRREMRALDREIEALQKEGVELHGVLASLRDGGIEIERIGRERLGLIRPGEITYRLVPMEQKGWSLDKEDAIQ